MYSLTVARSLPARLLVIALGWLVVRAASAYPIVNIADGSLQPNGGPSVAIQSNPVAFNVTPPTASSMEVLQYAGPATNFETMPVPTSQCGPAGGPYTVLASAVTASGDTITIPGPVRVVPAKALKAADPIFFRITDPNANMDPFAVDTVSVFLRVVSTGQRVELLVSETGPDTDVFTGHAAAGPCGLNLGLNAEIAIEYTDPTDPADVASAVVVVDPFGRVFDSSTGTLIDGAVITLLNADTDQPATVFSDNGLTLYPSTITSGGTVVDAAGTVFNLGTGEYRFPFIAPGRYRFRIVPPPGFSSPSVVPTARLQTLFSAPFEIVPGSRGETFVINPGPAVEIDIPLDPIDRAPFVTKSANKTQMSVGDLVGYRVVVSNPNATAALNDVVVTDTLPPGFRVHRDTVRLNGAVPARGMVSYRGSAFVAKIGDVAAQSETVLAYAAEAAAGTVTGDAVNNVSVAAAGGFHSNVASATIRVTDDLFRDRSLILGRVVVDSCDGETASDEHGLTGVGIYLEDGTYVVTDANGRYHFEGVMPGTHVVRLDATSVGGGYRVIHCRRNARASDGHSQFAEPTGGAPWRADFHVETVRTGVETVRPQLRAGEALVPSIPAFDRAWFERQNSAFEWIFPTDGDIADIPSTHILIKHAPGQTVSLSINGTHVSPLNFDTSWKNQPGTSALSHWRGVDLEDGDNTLTARLLARDGRELATREHVIHYSTAPVSVEFVPERSTLVADGRSIARLAIRLRDRDGHPVRAGIGGHYSLESPYIPYRSIDEESRRELNIIPDERPTFRVEGDGIAYLPIEPTNETGEIVATLAFDEHSIREVRGWMATPVRDWILVGLAEGTLAHRRISEHVEPLPPGGHDGLDTDGRVAFFARGRIRGEWLLTLSYDSSRGTGEERDTIRQQIRPDEYYTVYADASEQRTHAPSSGKLYLRIERNTFYALIGDYDTGLTVTELARYNRTLHGFKAGFRGEHVSYAAFGADTDTRFIKDEMRGDGTSGLYRLSGSRIVVNSEKVTLETRDRFHPERVIREEHLTRHIDYDIDYLDGTMFFKRAVPSRDFDFNPVFIVADYESDSRARDNIVAGGRVAAHLFDDRVEVGVSGIYEGVEGARADLEAVDLTLRPDAHTTLKFEAARSGNATGASREHGEAYLVEGVRNDGRLDGRVYFRHQDDAFGLGQQRGSEAGTRKYGAELEYALADPLTVDLEAFRQRNLETERRREVAETRLNYRLEHGSVFGGLRWARDSADGDDERSSIAAIAGGSRAVFDDRVLLRFTSDVALAGEGDNPDYPTRLVGGADFRINDAITLFAEHEMTAGPARDTHDTRIGSRTTPWQGAQMTSTVGRELGDSGNRIFSTSGFRQRWQIDERWSVDASLDRSGTLSDDRHAPLNLNAPPVSGTLDEDDDFTAVSAGLNYRLDALVAFSRWEFRTSESGDRAALGLGLYREMSDGIAYSGNLDGYVDTRDSGERDIDGELRLGIAWRPSLPRWLVLNRADLSFERRDRFDRSSRTLKFVNNTHAHYQWRDDTFVAGRAGIKIAHDTFEAVDATAVTTLAGLDVRHDLNDRWDAGVHGDLLRSWATGTADYSLGASVGFSPVANTRVVVGYNITGFEDDDFSGAEHSRKGAFVSFRMKFDERSARAVQKWLRPD